MKKLFANLRKSSENNKGFSLVELIIVIAIMVALVAMLAPQFTKYVQKSRDAVITTAAEDVLAMAKTEAAFNLLKQVNEENEGTITIRARNGNGPVEVLLENLEYNGKTGAEAQAEFEENCGVDSSKHTKTTLYYTITIAGTIHTQSNPGTIEINMDEHS
ncbi:MAG: prepilin-type N-terminal cleavage/methylation domain-containing protein [Clostridia bacterium]|nr:prepilin-type N-terminal cleavage/methylation domain-containing protein [Clostridia bacterium]